MYDRGEIANACTLKIKRRKGKKERLRKLQFTLDPV
jgi:hypothetical protein